MQGCDALNKDDKVEYEAQYDDKKGKWRKKKCVQKIAKCSSKKKFRKKCKATCCAITCVGSKC